MYKTTGNINTQGRRMTDDSICMYSATKMPEKKVITNKQGNTFKYSLSWDIPNVKQKLI